ncbi:MAG TPA: calcium/proton exchanger [Bryobacteraceae bacterium]|nr:calcium/proton exchanger [Bryobacteraceae bacterium]
MLNWLLIFVPIAIGLEFLAPESHSLIFLAACLAIVPLAGWLGRATEQLAAHTGEGVGGLLNATFGNAAELIIAVMALKNGLYPVVKASLTGSIIGNILLVLGAAVLAGGIKHKEQKFNATAARVQSTLLTLAAIALIMPAAFHYLAGPAGRIRENDLSLEISIVLLFAYGAHLLFSLHTHKRLFTGEGEEGTGTHEHAWSLRNSVLVLVVITALIAWVSEILVGSVQGAAATFGMTRVFIGVIVVAVIGNAAEHSTAVIMALKNKMELSIGIAVGSSLQIALFVAPALVILSHFIGPQSMDLVFTPAEVLAVFLSAQITSQISSDGESNWLEGVLLLSVYLILAIVFYFMPDVSATTAGTVPH